MTNSDPTQAIWFGVNIASGSALLASILSWLPPTVGVIGGILLIVRLLIEIKESPTYQEYRARRHARRLLRLRARMAELERLTGGTSAPPK